MFDGSRSTSHRRPTAPRGPSSGELRSHIPAATWAHEDPECDLSWERELTMMSSHEVEKEGVDTPDAQMSPGEARNEGVTGVAVGGHTAIAVGVEVTGTAVDTGPEPEKDPMVDRLVADVVRTVTGQVKDRVLKEEGQRRRNIRMCLRRNNEDLGK